MKVIAVVGSIRRGNTLKMVQEARSCFLPNEIQIIDLAHIKMEYCTGCLFCDTNKKCNINDDMTNLMESIEEADAYIFASPVRWSLLSGEMKTFFDRLNPFATSGILNGKKCIIFTVGQSEENSEDAFSIDEGLRSMEFFCANAGIDVIGSVKAYGCLEENSIEKTSYIKDCRYMAKKLRDALL